VLLLSDVVGHADAGRHALGGRGGQNYLRVSGSTPTVRQAASAP
jgi:hypothetical protein